MPYQMVDQRGLSPPIVGEAAEVWDDKGNVGIFFGQDLRDRDLAHHIIENRQTVAPGRSTDFPRNPGVVAMHFDANEAEPAHRLPDHGFDSALIGQGMNKSEPEKAAGIACNNPRHLSIGLNVSIRERCKDDRSINAGLASALEILVERRGSVRRLSQPVALAGMTVAVD